MLYTTYVDLSELKTMPNEVANAIYCVLTPRREVLIDKLIVPHIDNINFPPFMDDEGSFPRSQANATGQYSKSADPEKRVCPVPHIKNQNPVWCSVNQFC
jgi:hypothetical protein